MKGYGLSGEFALWNYLSTKLYIYRFGRISHQSALHIEDDLMKLLQGIKINDKIILISSYYSPCEACQSKLTQFVEEKYTYIKLYYWVQFSMIKIENMSERIELKKLNPLKNDYLNNKKGTKGYDKTKNADN